MASPDNHLDGHAGGGGDISGTRRPGSNKRSFGETGDEKDDFFCFKKGYNTRSEEEIAATGTILSLRENLKNCRETLSICHSEIQTLRSSEESLQKQLEKAKKKEAAFILSIAKRDQEISDLKSCLRARQCNPPLMEGRKLLLDPAIHGEFTRLKNLVDEKGKKVNELQDTIAAVNFTPQSKNGKLLMAKCRTLQEENEEMGDQANAMAMKLALQKSQNAGLRSHLEGLSRQIEGLSNDAEVSHEMVFVLQEKLEEKDVAIRRLRKELEKEKVIG